MLLPMAHNLIAAQNHLEHCILTDAHPKVLERAIARWEKAHAAYMAALVKVIR
jgi:hypothetical protein